MQTIEEFNKKNEELEKDTREQFEGMYKEVIAVVEDAYMRGLNTITYAMNTEDKLNHRYFWEGHHPVISRCIAGIDIHGEIVTIYFGR